MTAIAQLDGQLDFFDVMESESVFLPKFEEKQSIFIRSLDVILNGKIGHSWICDEKSKNPYYGYSIDFDEGHHTVVWDYSIGDTAFDDESQAVESALNAEKALTKINPADLQMTELKSYSYIREMDGYRLTATIAKVGDNQLYEHEFMCYHFLRTYKDLKKRDNAYREILKKISKEAEESEAIELNPPAFDTLYKVDSGLYASRGFAEHQYEIRQI